MFHTAQVPCVLRLPLAVQRSRRVIGRHAHGALARARLALMVQNSRGADAVCTVSIGWRVTWSQYGLPRAQSSHEPIIRTERKPYGPMGSTCPYAQLIAKPWSPSGLPELSRGWAKSSHTEILS